jgi:predicted nucleic acid-binding protein
MMMPFARSRILPLPVDASRTYGALRAELEAGGRNIGNNDLWIAAHAKARQTGLGHEQQAGISTRVGTRNPELGEI